MPLGERAGDKSESRYCGVETEFNDDMPHLLSFNIHGGFDFLVAPLVRIFLSYCNFFFFCCILFMFISISISSILFDMVIVLVQLYLAFY